MHFQKILCPVDFSESSGRALDYALALTRSHGGQVTVMHVLPRAIGDPEAYPYLTESLVTTKETRDRALHQLGSFVHRALALNVPTRVSLEEGDVVDTLLEKSEREGAELVVMGTHGRRGFQRLLLGSVTERVLRQSRLPVLTVSPSAAPPKSDGAPFRRILCPVDFSPSSLAGLELAIALSGADGELTVLHLVEFYLGAGSGEGYVLDLRELRERNRVQAVKQLEEAVPAALLSRVRLEVAVLESSGPYREILRRAQLQDSEVIVIGVQGRSASDLLFFGSTTNHVVRSAPCPVLTVRARE